MNGIELGSTVYALGWSLVHFLWQGALIALALELALVALRRSSPDVRYFVRLGALALMGLAPVATFLVIRPEVGPVQAVGGSAVVDGDAATLWGRLTWLTVVVAIWSVGAALFGARLLRDYLRVRRLQNSAAGVALPHLWQSRFDRIADAMGVRAVARVVDSARLTAPVVIGWVKPVVLIPARVLTGLTQDQIEALIAHELAHVSRHDFLINLVQSALEALLFYHPAVWWVSKGIRVEREYCCDDMALRVTNDEVTYARALTTLESWRGVEPQVGMSTLGGSLMLRIQRMVGIRNSNPRVRGPLAALGALFVASTLGATAFGYAAPQDPEELRELREQIDELQGRIDRLRAQLHDATGPIGSGHKVRVERLHGGGASGNVWIEDDGEEGVVIDLDDLDGNEFKFFSGGTGSAHGDGEATVRVEVFGLPDGVEIQEHIEKALGGHGGHSKSQNKVILRGVPNAHELHEHIRKALESHGVEWDGKDGEHVVVEGLGEDLHERIQAALERAGVHGLTNSHTIRLHDALREHGDALHEHGDALHGAFKLRAPRMELHMDGDGDVHGDYDDHGDGKHRRFRIEVKGDDGDLHEHLEQLPGHSGARTFELRTSPRIELKIDGRVIEDLHEEDSHDGDGRRVRVFKSNTSNHDSDGADLLERIRRARHDAESERGAKHGGEAL